MSAQYHILVVEDEPMVSQAVVMVCGDEGMKVTAIDNATDALQRLAADGFDLVLCDIMMQGLDGFQLLEELDRRHVRTPVVMTTGFSTMENAVKSLSMGAIDYIPKPFTADELLTVVRRSLRSGELLEKAQSAGLPRNGSLIFVPCPDGYHKLGYVSWALMEDEGTARIGVSDLFLKAAEGISALELEEQDEELVQGTPCAVAVSPDGSRHGIMCPMSGQILDINTEARAHPSLVEKDPYFKGWLYRILPSNPENNLRWLSL